jgi:hypothetical protein
MRHIFWCCCSFFFFLGKKRGIHSTNIFHDIRINLYESACQEVTKKMTSTWVFNFLFIVEMSIKETLLLWDVDDDDDDE